MEKKTSVFIVSVTMAAALGYTGGLHSAGVSEVRASYKREPVVTNMQLSAAQKSCFEACIDDAICASVDSKLGLSGEHSCSAAKNAESFCFQVQRGNSDKDGPLPDTASLSGTSGHDMTLTQGRPPSE